MKFKIYILFLLSLFSISLNACSTKENVPDTAGSVTPVNEEKPLASAADAYKAVLQDETGFISTEDNREAFLSDFLSRNSEFEGTYNITRFAVLDMDGDHTPEVILELSLNDSPEQYEILHCSDGTVYGSNFVYRDIEMLKADGTYTYANGAADVGVTKILSFHSGSVETETLGYTQSDFSGDEIKISYFVHGAAVTKEAFDSFYDEQNEKKDVQWYEFSPENIDAQVRMDLGANSPTYPAAAQESYYGDWEIQKVLAYGTGTFSVNAAEDLVGKSLTFSAEEAWILTDQGSDAVTIINNPEYQKATQTKEEFQADYQMSFDTLGINTDSIEVVQVISSNETGGTFLIKDNNTLILIGGGTYFELIKQ